MNNHWIEVVGIASSECKIDSLPSLPMLLFAVEAGWGSLLQPYVLQCI